MNFDVCSIAIVMYLLNGVPFSIFVLIHDYYTPLNLDGFPNATTLLSLCFTNLYARKSNISELFITSFPSKVCFLGI